MSSPFPLELPGDGVMHGDRSVGVGDHDSLVIWRKYRRVLGCGYFAPQGDAPRWQFESAKLPSPFLANLVDEIPFPVAQTFGASRQKLQRPRRIVRVMFVVR